MRHLVTLFGSITHWLGSFGDRLPLGFITASDIAYADWPEAAQHPQPWKRCF